MTCSLMQLLIADLGTQSFALATRMCHLIVFVQNFVLELLLHDIEFVLQFVTL